MSEAKFVKIAEMMDPIKSPFSIGPKLIQLNWIINTQKAGTIFVMYTLMCYYQNFSLGAWIYLSLHGTYGVIWIIKDMTFPDKSFQEKTTIMGALVTSIILFAYWSIGIMMMCGYGDQSPSPRKIFSCFFIFTLGVILMVCTDLQKYLILSFKKGLIDNYFLSCNRNTNYFGEILVYLSFALVTNKLSGYIILIIIWSTLFGSRIYLKEVSLSKKEGYAKYASRSYLILFKFFDSDIANGIAYLGIVLFIIGCYLI